MADAVTDSEANVASVTARRRVWFARARAYAAWVWLTFAVVMIAVGLAGAFDGIDRRTEIVILLMGVLLGLPHGALDHRVAQVLAARRVKQPWVVKFLATYLGIAAIVALLWWWQPVFALMAFLIVSAAHFGAGDVELRFSSEIASEARPKFESILRGCNIVAVGSAIVMVPCVFFTQEVATLFGWITKTSSQPWAWVGHHPVFRGVLACVFAFAAMAWIAAKVGVQLLKFSPSGAAEVNQPPLMLEVLIVAALFASVPPLISFSIYFALLHAPRHTLLLAARLRKGEPVRDLVWVFWQSLPLTAVTVVAGIALYIWLSGGQNVGITSNEAMVRSVFWLLAALTFPHMWLTWQWERSMSPLLSRSRP
jgi:beta-carotene 15,15'-dioxygenase